MDLNDFYIFGAFSVTGLPGWLSDDVIQKDIISLKVSHTSTTFSANCFPIIFSRCGMQCLTHYKSLPSVSFWLIRHKKSRGWDLKKKLQEKSETAMKIWPQAELWL